MKAGLLLPRSGAYPGIALDLTTAIRLCLKQHGKEEAIQFVSENIGFGGSDKEIYGMAEKLLVTEGVDLLIAYMDMKVMPILEPLIMATGKLLIVLNTGANYPDKKIPQPGIIYMTLQHSFLCSLTGKIAGNAPGIYATTFYDCGYMHGAAMLTNFEKNNGAIIFNYVNQDLYDDRFNIAALTDFLAAHPEKNVNILCIFDETPAALFYKRLNEYEHADQLRLFVSPMMLTKNAIAEGGYTFSIEGYTGWLPGAGDTENKTFTNLYKSSFKKDPAGFSLSGWQAGLFLNELLNLPEETTASPEDRAKAFAEIKLSAPGGSLSFDPHTHFYLTDTVYHCSLPAGATELIIAPEKTGKKDWDDYLALQNDLPASGWTNTYLCY
jgi:branched-chain amino acid transport system substrate-binding protein